MRGASHKDQTPVLTGELQQLRTALHVFRNSPGTLEREALRASRHAPRYAKPDPREIEELRALVAALPESGQRRRLLNVPNLASIFGHAGLIAFVLLCASHQVSRSGLIPVSIEFVAKDSHQSKPLEKPGEPKLKPSLSASRPNTEVTPIKTLVNHPGAADKTERPESADQSERSVPASFSAPAGSNEPSENYLWNANAAAADSGGGLVDFHEQEATASPELKVVRKTDWQGNPVED